MTSDRLDSWKEIAAHLNRSVRTVTRWEREEGLPIHRHLHSKSGSVYAYKAELDDWWKNRGVSVDASDSEGQSPRFRSARPLWIRCEHAGGSPGTIGDCLAVGRAAPISP